MTNRLIKPGEIPDVCVLCDTPRDTSGPSASLTGDEREITCRRCGRYTATRQLWAQIDDFSEEDRLAVSALVREHADRGEPFPQVLATATLESIAHAATSPRSVGDRISHFLAHVAERERFFGKRTKPESPVVWAARAYLLDDQSLKRLSSALQTAGLIEADYSTQSGAVNFSLTIAGWEYLERHKKGLRSTQVFAAMWNDAVLNPLFDLGILPACEDAGLKAVRVNNPPITGKIDDHIVAEIRRSRLLVVDVTGERPNAYFEAGFAMGLGIPVIWTCNESWTTRLPKFVEAQGTQDPTIVDAKWPDRMHFDTRQYPHILWKDPQELRKALYDRISALGIAIR